MEYDVAPIEVRINIMYPHKVNESLWGQPLNSSAMFSIIFKTFLLVASIAPFAWR